MITLALVSTGCATPPSPAPAASAPSSTFAVSGGETSTPTTTPDPPPPYIDHVTWTSTDVGTSLSVYPTPAGRRASAESAMATAWREVITLAPDANTPTMQAQFDCHWTFARAIAPDKASWNLEPARPVVSDDEMIATRCNPGGAEEGPVG